MRRCLSFFLLSVLSLAAAAAAQGARAGEDFLRKGFRNPPQEALVRCYWWWLNGNVTEAGITRDLEGMKSHGIAGAILVDADGSGQEGNAEVRVGPAMGSPEWMKLYVHALKEADRLGLEISLNVTSRWDVGIIGGATVTPEDAQKLLVFSRTTVGGGGKRTVQLKAPRVEDGYYRRIAVLAYPLKHGAALAGVDGSGRAAIPGLRKLAAMEEAGFSVPSIEEVTHPVPATPGEQDADTADVVDVSAHVSAAHQLEWDFPAGTWEVLEAGYTVTPHKLVDYAKKTMGLPLDVMSTKAMDDYWRDFVTPMLDAGKPYIGRSLKYLVTDSWESGGANWTDDFATQFARRRGYDPVKFLPVVAGRLVESRARSEAFLFDLRRTTADLIAENYYDRFAAKAAAAGLGTHPEAGGPHGAPIDALRNFEHVSFPQTEFWVESDYHRVSERDRIFVKEAASAAHIYGQRFVAAEGETSMERRAWSESLGGNLQPTFDQALTEGLNRLFWHEFTSSSVEEGLPGQEYFAGTHLNPNVTWWAQAPALLKAFARSQFLLQQGQPVSDVLYFYGDQAPNFVQNKTADPAGVLPGYDYDVTDERALLTRMHFAGAELKTPEGAAYRVVMLPKSRALSVAALKWVASFVQQGGAVIGEKPTGPLGNVSDAERKEYARLADEIWSGCGSASESHYGKGRVECIQDGAKALAALKVAPDFSYQITAGSDAQAGFDFVHRTTPDAEIYFVRSKSHAPVKATLSFRVKGRAPELWTPADGGHASALIYRETTDGRTEIPLALPARGSVFVLFAHAGGAHLVNLKRDGAEVFPSAVPGVGVFATGDGALAANEPGSYEGTDSNGKKIMIAASTPDAIVQFSNWTLTFPSGWGVPASVALPEFKSWTEMPNEGVKYFSGTATYHSSLQVPAAVLNGKQQVWLNLGDVREIATIKVNGKPVETLWYQPFVARIDEYLHEGANAVEIEVTNLWPNRLIGDAQPGAKRYTKTNVQVYKQDSPLMPSGLLAPVTVQVESVQQWRK